jgi:hypothetical protein
VALVVDDQGLALAQLDHAARELVDHQLDHLGLEGAVGDALLPALPLGHAGGERVPRVEVHGRQVPAALDLRVNINGLSQMRHKIYSAMTAKVQELINEVVWSSDQTVSVGVETKKILDQHVYYMLRLGPTLISLIEWTTEQITIQNGKKSRLEDSITQMTRNKVDCASVVALRDHHNRISWRYKTVQDTVCLWKITH